jgi:hypothetical protein
MIRLAGPPHARGRAQALLAPESIPLVRAAVAARLEAAAPLLAQPRIQRYLARQRDFADTHDPEGIAEMDGIAEGYHLDPADLFAFLHAGQFGGLSADGCTAWAHVHPELGAIVVKNRDLRGPALPLQRVFLHQDPAWGARRVMCVGSLGAPGAYSSGINSDGFALVDTQVVTTDQGVGLLRYFLMSRLLATCGTVAEAIEALHGTGHAGGGTLVIADARGAIAAVEIGHSALGIERPAASWTARTNHFVSAALQDRLLPATNPDHSRARLAHLRAWLAGRTACPSDDDARSIMSSHDTPTETGLCRHGGREASTTVSCAIFACGAGTLAFAHGTPCDGTWSRHAI